MDFQDITLGQIPYDFTYRQDLKEQNKQIKQNRNTFVDAENKLMVARGEDDGRWEMDEKGEGKKRHKLPVIK